MKGKIFMNQEIVLIDVELKKQDGNDILEFKIKEGCKVNLNSENSQNELKNVFSAILEEMMKHNVQLKLTYEKEYTARLYIDVCEEYVKALNNEINNVYEKIPYKNIEENML